VKRHNIELMIAWPDALRRRDSQALLERLDPQTTWQGIRPDLVCHGREIVEIFVAQRDQDYDVDELELIGAPDHAILHFRLAEPRQIGNIEVEDGMYHVFRIQGSTITRIEDYLDRAEALRAASLT
jgi:limonene-1,2-epoxide hydrolase